MAPASRFHWLSAFCLAGEDHKESGTTDHAIIKALFKHQPA